MSAPSVVVERLTRNRRLGVVVVAYVFAALLVAGPWIFTMLGIVGLSGSGCAAPCDGLITFRTVVIYNSVFSLVVTSPLAFFAGRYVADQVCLGKTESVFATLAAAIGLFGLATLAIAAPFYLWAPVLDGPTRVVAIQNVFLLGLSWLLIPFLGVSGAFRATLVAFGTGALLMLAFGSALAGTSATQRLVVFNASFAVTDIILIVALVRQFGRRVCFVPGLADAWRRRWELPLAGLAYAVGIWGDKVVMWYGAPSGGLVIAGALRTFPSYDTAMFWAHLASIPVIAVAFVHVDARLPRLFARFYGRFDQHASLRELNAAMRDLRMTAVSSVVMLFVALAVVATMTILVSVVFMNELGLRPAYMSILRIAVWAMAFHTSTMFCFVFLLYFDLRRQALLVVGAYAALNPLLTALLLPLGTAFYGYGNMISGALCFLLGFGVLLRELPWLHYHAFVTNNTSL
jgi:polysaccharide biosynthesis protein PelG